MNARQMGQKVSEYVERMMEAANDGDVGTIEELNEKGYEYARGSNARKDELRDGYNAALAKVAADKRAAEEEEAAQAEMIDANAVATFPTVIKKEHIVFIPQPAPRMTDAERDEYTAKHVTWPAGWQLMGTIATRAQAGDRAPHGWNIRLRFQPVA